MVMKGRYFIIVKKLDYGNGKLRIGMYGIYSNGDTGLENVREGRHRKLFSLCPLNIDISDFENLVSENPVLKVD